MEHGSETSRLLGHYDEQTDQPTDDGQTGSREFRFKLVNAFRRL